MFKRLKDRLTDEPKQPTQKDLINLSDNSSEFFAISEDGEASDTSSPLRQQAARPLTAPSDTESDRDDLRLDNIGKEQLYMILESVKGRYRKYKTRALEYSKTNAELQEEVEKLKHTLAESQDRTLRRVAELREQCVLEQQAKAHLEENLRLVIDEKEQVIQVLQTQIKLLKDNAEKEDDTSSEISCTADLPTLQERVKRQEALLGKCKETIQKNKERQAQLQTERESLASRVDRLTSENSALQVRESMAQEELRLAQGQLADLAQQREEGLMAMAETKHNMHNELEHREKQLGHLRKQVQELDSELSSLKATLEDVVSRNATAELNWEKEMAAIKKEGDRQLELCRKQLENKEKDRAALDQQLLEETSSLKEALASQTQALAKANQERENFQRELAQLESALAEESIKVSSLQSDQAHLTKQLEEKDKANLALVEERDRKLQALEAELETRSEEVGRLAAILRDREADIKALSCSLETQSHNLESLHHRYSSETSKLQESLRELTDHLTVLKQDEQDRRGGLTQLEQNLSTGKDALERLAREGEKTQSELVELSQQLDLCASKLSNSTGDVSADALRQKIEDLHRTCLALETEKRQLSHKWEELRKLGSEQEAQIDCLQTQLAEKKNEIEALEKKNIEKLAALGKELESSKREIGSLNHMVAEKSQMIATCENEQLALHRQLDILQVEISDKRMQLEELISSHNEKDVEIASLKDQLGAKESQFAATQKELKAECNQVQKKCMVKMAALEEGLKSQESQVEALRSQLREKEDLIRSLEVELDHLKSNHQQTKELLSANESQTEETQAELNRCKEKLEEAEHSLSERAQKIQSLEQEIQILQEPLEEAAQRSQAEEIRYKVLEASMLNKEKEHELMEYEFIKTKYRVEELEKMVETQTQEQEELREMLREYDEEMALLRGDAQTKVETMENLKEELRKKASECNGHIAKLEQSQQQIAEMKQSLADQEEEFVLKTKEFHRRLEELQCQLSEKEKAINDLQDNLLIAEDKLIALQEQHNNIIEAKKKEIGEIVTLLEKQLDVQAEEIASLEESTSTEIAKLKEELAALKSTNENLSQELAARSKEIETLSGNLQEKETKSNTLETKLQEQMTEALHYKALIEEKKQKLEAMECQLNSKQSTSDQTFQVDLSDLAQNHHLLRKQLEDHSQDFVVYHQRIEECQRELEELTKSLKEETGKLESLRGSSTLEHQIANFTARLETQSKHTQALERSLEGQLEQLKGLQDLRCQSLEELDRFQDAKIYAPLQALEERVTAELARKQAEILALQKQLDFHSEDAKVSSDLDPDLIRA